MCKQLNEDETQLFQCTFILTVPSLKQKRGTYRNEGANSIGAFINKDKFEGGALVRQGALIGRRAPKRIITVSLYCSIKIIAIKPTRLCISVELLEKGLGPGTVTTEHFPNDHSQNTN